MYSRKRLILALCLVALWLAVLVAARGLLLPMLGAATVLQMEASNASHFWSVNLMNAASLVVYLIVALFGAVFYLIFRNKK